jgi:hypothetical protein
MPEHPPRFFNHDIRPCADDWLSLSPAYSARAFCLTRPGDTIQIDPELEPLWPDIRDHYRRVGLNVTDNVIWDLSLDRIAEFSDSECSVFHFSDEIHALRPDEAWLSVVKLTNSKNDFIDLAARLGAPTPLTRCFSGFDELAASDLDDMPYPWFFKPAVSISGYGIQRCEDRQAVLEIARKLPADIPVQLQEEVPADRFLNLQYHVVGGRLTREVASEQIMSNFEHIGNRCPVDDPPWSICDPIAIWMHNNGMKGVFAFDVAVQDQDGSPRYWILECNPRFNGATYPAIIANRLGIPQWSHQSLRVEKRRKWLEDLKNYEYDPSRKSGAILVNWGGMYFFQPSLMLVGSAAA